MLPNNVKSEFLSALGCVVDPVLLVRALIHRSYSYENNLQQTNERLEFLGDAVLGFIVGNELYSAYSDLQEGMLTQLRAYFVCESCLADVARKIGINKVVLLGLGETRSHGNEKNSILSDTFEALVAAVYLSNGMEVVSDFVKRTVLEDIDKAKALLEQNKAGDYKAVLRDLIAQKGYDEPIYEYAEAGPDHAKMYTATLTFPNVPDFRAVGTETTRRKAASFAAKNAVEKLNKQLTTE
ncbi:MAG: ribonuclease III [Candidatus Ancillula trichonymphae]|nr:ribonuclease III [Candidatus Ancillula trichonymphae]